MPRGYDALRDVLASGKAPNSPTVLRPHISNILNDPIPSSAPPPLPPTQPLPPTPMPAPAPIPYAPKRISPPTTVLLPLTPEEYESFKIPRHALRARAQRPDPSLENPHFFPPNMRPSKRKLAQLEEERAAKRTRDSGRVVEHYNSRRDVGVTERRDSPIIGLKNFNNWIKSILIAKFSKQAFDPVPQPPSGRGSSGPSRLKGKVLDMGCGKGGDLQKWQKARIAQYVGLDIANVSVQQAQSRWAQMKGHRFGVHFAALDCYTEPISTAVPPHHLASPFDMVSMQFCMHYAFETVQKARMMLENVSKYLRPGGIFIGTVPNAEWLMERLRSIPTSSPPQFGNSVFQVKFEQPLGPQVPTFGHRYWFYLKDAVEDVPEYVVHWDHFELLAQEYGLQVVYKKEFHDIFAEEQDHKDFGPLLHRMKVVSENGESEMDEDQWEAANIYLAFALQKR